jgi:hypothetical protein
MGYNNENASRLFLDIETSALPDAALFLEAPEPPSNWKDPLKRQAYIEEKLNEQIEKAALDPDLCRIVCIGTMREDEDEPSTLIGPEVDMIAEFWMRLGDRVTVGYNHLGFDLPFLIRRSQYLGIPAPALNLDKYRTPHIDLQQKLSFNGQFKFRSLDFYVKRFALDVPSDPFTGKDITALVAAGKWEAVMHHCAVDVVKVAALARRLGYCALSPVEAVL